MISRLTLETAHHFPRLAAGLGLLARLLGRTSMVACPIRDPRTHDTRAGEIFPGEHARAMHPRQWHQAATWTDINHPSIGFNLIPDGLVVPASPLVITRRGEALCPHPPGVDPRIVAFTNGHGLMAINTSASVGLCSLPEAERIERGIHLGGLCFENWYHWSIELASRATFIDLLPLHLRDFPVLVPKWRLTAAPNFRAVLEAAGVGDRLRFVDPDRPIRVKELVIIDSPAAFPVCMRGVHTWPVGSATIHPTAISHFRQAILSAAGVDSSRRSAERRLLLTRRDRPRVANYRSLYRIFADRGFEQIHMEDIGFIDQVRLMSAASTVAGATGAAWSGALFAQAGSRGLCLCDRKDASLGVFPNLAAQAGMDLRYVFGDCPMQVTDESREHGIHIDPAELARALNALLG